MLKPRQEPNNPHLWHPGIKLGVHEGSFTHQTELFGPVLGLMRANDLNHAIQLANGTRYGLTGGIHTLDEREQKLWIQKIHVGNAYINRAITGSMVQRQPFGGMKASVFGQAFKAGGPQYVLQFVHAKQTHLPEGTADWIPRVLPLYRFLADKILSASEKERWKHTLCNYAFYWRHYFSHPQDPSCLIGQDNLLYYIPRKELVIRFQEGDSPFDLFLAIGAALTCGSHLLISGPSLPPLIPLPRIAYIEENESSFLERIGDRRKKESVFFTPLSFISKNLCRTRGAKHHRPCLDEWTIRTFAVFA